MHTEPQETTMSNLIPLSKVKELWTIPGKKPPCTTTIYNYRRKGIIPKPIQVGRDNLYNREDVIKMRDSYLQSLH